MCYPVVESLGDYLKLSLIMLVVYTLYEVGYIQNDNETTKKESNPTRRVGVSDAEYYEKNKWKIYSVRILIALAGLALLFFLGEPDSAYLLFIIPVFYIYNSIRSVWNLPVHFILVVLRFSIPVFVINSSATLFLGSLLIFPVVNLLERASEPRFGLVWFQNFQLSDKGKGRYIYYMMVLVLLLSCIVLGGVVGWDGDVGAVKVAFFVSCYMFLYRFLSFKVAGRSL